jgi:hypothetical protein
MDTSYASLHPKESTVHTYHIIDAYKRVNDDSRVCNDGYKRVIGASERVIVGAKSINGANKRSVDGVKSANRVRASVP